MHTQLPISQSHSELQIEETKPDQLSRRQMIKLALSTVILGGFGTMPAQVIPQSIVRSKASEAMRAQIKNEVTRLVTAYGQVDLSLQFFYDTDRASANRYSALSTHKTISLLPSTNIDLIFDIYEQENPKFTSWTQFAGHAAAEHMTSIVWSCLLTEPLVLRRGSV